MSMQFSQKVSVLLFLLLIVPSSAYANNHGAALGKAQQAFLIQTGIKKHLRECQRVANKELRAISKELGIQEEAGVILGFYYIYTRKQVTIKMQDSRITLTPNSISVSLGF